MRVNYKKLGKQVIELEIKALNKLKNSLNSSFEKAVDTISKCQSKVILCGVGKSGIIASKISATLSSVGTPSFSISASDCSHGDLGSISKKDILILISLSGNTEELKNIIEYANRNKIKLISIVSRKDSLLYKNSNINILIPEVKESGYGIVPTSSTTCQLAIGDAIAIALMKYKRFSKLDFKKFHPSGNLGKKLRTVEDLMLKNQKIPFVNESAKITKAINVINSKKLGVVIIKNKKNVTKGIFTDGDVKRLIQKNKNYQSLLIKDVMTKNPFSTDKDTLAAKALSIMNENKITSLCVYKKPNKSKTIGIIHIHNLIESNIT